MNATTPPPTAQTPTLHGATPQDTPSPPVRPTQPLTAARRQQAYRQRSKHAVTQAIGNEAHASRVTLLALLGRDLALLDDDAAKSMHSAVRNSARRVMNTLVTRYAINLEGQDRT